ncbi:MAG: phage holin family protein [Bacillota bacterium]
MLRFESVTDTVVLGLKALLFYALGDITYQFYYLIFLIIADTALGLVVSMRCAQFKYSVFLKKLTGKIGFYLLAIALFNAFDQIAELPHTARWLCLIALAGLELVSAFKNLSLLGYPNLAKALAQAYRDIFRSNLPTLTEPVEGEGEK